MLDSLACFFNTAFSKAILDDQSWIAAHKIHKELSACTFEQPILQCPQSPIIDLVNKTAASWVAIYAISNRKMVDLRHGH